MQRRNIKSSDLKPNPSQHIRGTTINAEAWPARSVNVERGQVCPFYGGLGIEVYPTSARVHPIGVRPGVADLICFFPRLGFHFFHETKVLPRRQTKEQWEFEQHCIASKVPYVLGGIDEAMAFVVFLEIATPVGPTVRFKPRSEWPAPIHSLTSPTSGRSRPLELTRSNASATRRQHERERILRALAQVRRTGLHRRRGLSRQHAVGSESKGSLSGLVHQPYEPSLLS
jgi:hypothetical protein